MACAERTGPGPHRLGLKCYLAWGVAGGPGPGQKFRSTLAEIAKILQENDIFLINTHYFFGERVFCRQKNPGGNAAGLAPGVWSYPITFRSLVVKHTALTQNFPVFSQIFEFV